MKFQLRSILSEIKELYSKPVSTERFKEYISKLEGNKKGDLDLPISGFNPMAKEHVLGKIEELENLSAEKIIQNELALFNAKLNNSDKCIIEVVINLADDLKGGWTNFYTTDFDSKFKLNAFVTRNFCVPYFWTSESFSKKIIQIRTKEYLFRTLYWKANSKPRTLKDHLEQEIFVYRNTVLEPDTSKPHSFEPINTFYLQNKNSEEYDLIFNFFYGDLASNELGYKTYGITDISGFDYARFIAGNKELHY